VDPSPDRKLSMLHSTLRMDARLDEPTRPKVDGLAQHFHQPRAAVLCPIMHWGLSHGRQDHSSMAHHKARGATFTSTSHRISMHELRKRRLLPE
jgi:hypothetical protein